MFEMAGKCLLTTLLYFTFVSCLPSMAVLDLWENKKGERGQQCTFLLILTIFSGGQYKLGGRETPEEFNPPPPPDKSSTASRPSDTSLYPCPCDFRCSMHVTDNSLEWERSKYKKLKSLLETASVWRHRSVSRFNRDQTGEVLQNSTSGDRFVSSRAVLVVWDWEHRPPTGCWSDQGRYHGRSTRRDATPVTRHRVRRDRAWWLGRWHQILLHNRQRACPCTK